MKMIKTFNEANCKLEAYKGAHVEVCHYHATLHRLALKITATDKDEILYLHVSSIQYLKGHFDWEGADLKIVSLDDDSPIEVHGPVKVSDESAGFEAHPGGCVLLVGKEGEFGDSIDNLVPHYAML